jgi:hypothetical protein
MSNHNLEPIHTKRDRHARVAKQGRLGKKGVRKKVKLSEQRREEKGRTGHE